ncbi:lysylphosphatidylglycerol synthase transmembrane domain-containing protein [Rhizomonospora bruguierae]|uniref:lysylphosphatidylglycerol synthase transmembrane domain-containing protein n=1 Tax=Rhizomonospora bruguierae TaxID=1581705 RepID=UPI001BCCFECB|nr:YbhN family protein [Micromonospora sp. NBRC 107566]
MTGGAGARRWRQITITIAVLGVLTVELVVGWPSLAAALAQLRTPSPAWLAAAVAAEVASMGVFARMQRRLLRSAGTRVHLARHVALAYAAHSLSVTLPGGPVFSTTFTFRQLRRFGASAAVASWCVALSGVLSTGALIVIGAAVGILARSGGGWTTLGGCLATALVIVLAIRVLAQHPQCLASPAARLMAGVNRLRGRPREHGADRVTALVDQILAVRIRPMDLSMAAAFAIANWLLDAACLLLCCRAVGAQGITVVQLVIAYAAGMAAASIPLVPGGLGVVDGALVLGLVAGGLPASGAIAAVVLYRLVSFGFIIGAGWVFWLIIRRAGFPPEPQERGVLARVLWYLRCAQWRTGDRAVEPAAREPEPAGTSRG